LGNWANEWVVLLTPVEGRLASGVLNSDWQMGGTVGVALSGVVMESFPTPIGFACATGSTVVLLIATAHVTSRRLPGWGSSLRDNADGLVYMKQEKR
jgi:hypothetical protein